MHFLPNNASASSLGRPHLIAATTLPPSLSSTGTFLSDHLPNPLMSSSVQTAPDFPGVPKVQTCLSRPPSSSGRCHAALPLPPLWPTGDFISDNLPRPIAVILADRGWTSLAFPKCNSSPPGRPLLLAADAAVAAVAHRSLLLRLQSPNHSSPPPPRPRPAFPSVPKVQLCNSSSPGLAAAAVAEWSLPLQPQSLTHRRPPPPGQQPDFPGIVKVQLFLSRPPLLLPAAAVVVDRILPL